MEPNFKIETSTDTSVNYQFYVTACVAQSFISSEYDIWKTFGVGLKSELNFVCIGIESELKIRDSAHLYIELPQYHSILISSAVGSSFSYDFALFHFVQISFTLPFVFEAWMKR